MAPNVGPVGSFADVICLMSIFLVALVILRLSTETLAPAMVRFPTPVYHIGRILFGIAGSTLLMAIILLAFETAPVHKKVFGVVDYQRKPPFGLGLDRQWLGFFQYSTGYIFGQFGPPNDPRREYPGGNVFDPNAEWLLRHQDARPYGTETVLSGEGGDAGTGGGVEGGGGGGGEAAAGAGGGGGRPGDIKVIGPAVGGGVVVPN
jgi:hypothetical protein